jgi:hypothetical protein
VTASGRVTRVRSAHQRSLADRWGGRGAERELTIRNLDDEAHTVTSFDGAIDVEVGPGEEVEILTPEPGAYLYSCRFHPEMGGEIDVM